MDKSLPSKDDEIVVWLESFVQQGEPRAIGAAKYAAVAEMLATNEEFTPEQRQYWAEVHRGWTKTAAYKELNDLRPEMVEAELEHCFKHAPHAIPRDEMISYEMWFKPDSPRHPAKKIIRP